MAEIHLAGYCDRFSARPGERLDIMVNAEGTDRVELQLVRLIHGDENPEGPGFVEREVAAPVNGTHAVAKQHTQLGSFVRVADPGPARAGRPLHALGLHLAPDACRWPPGHPDPLAGCRRQRLCARHRRGRRAGVPRGRRRRQHGCAYAPTSRSSRASGIWWRPPTTRPAARPRSIRSRWRTATTTTSPRSCRFRAPAMRARGLRSSPRRRTRISCGPPQGTARPGGAPSPASSTTARSTVRASPARCWAATRSMPRTGGRRRAGNRRR